MEVDKIYNLIRDFNNDSNVIKLKNYYKTTTFMEILGVTRSELAHSSFLWWLFNDNVNYDLGLRPLTLLLDLLVNKIDEQFPGGTKIDSNGKEFILKDDEQISDEDKKAIILRKANIKIENIKTEHAIEGGRVDLYIQFYIENDEYKKNHYAIILENKVKARENENKEGKKYQTELYYNYFSSQKNNIKNIFVYLTPDLTKKKAQAESRKFINITYNNIVDNIIKPLLSDDSLSSTVNFILNDYIKSLSKPIFGKQNGGKNDKGNNISMIKIPQPGNSQDDDFQNDSGIDDRLIESMKAVQNKYENNFKEIVSLKHEKRELTENEQKIIDIFDEFIFDELNRLVIGSVCPEIINKRSRNNTFEELNIEEGTTLYFVPKAQSNEIDPNIVVRTEDSINKVSYIDEKTKEIRYGTISSIAKLFCKVDYQVNGFRYFAKKDKNNQYINLSKIEK